MERVIDGVRVKIQLVSINLFDSEAIVKHLEEMAAQGWSFKRFQADNIWEYYYSEPRKVRYAVTYMPDANNDGTLNEEQQTMDELCAKAGWQRVTSHGAAQIYSSTLENPVPVETDELSRFRVIKKSMFNQMGNNFLMCIIWGAMLWMRGRNFLSNPVELLASYGELIVLIMTMFIVLHWGMNAVVYGLWTVRSAKSIKNGGSCCDFELFYSINDWTPVVSYLLLIAAYFAFDFHWGVLILMLVLVGIWMVNGEFSKLKRIFKGTGEIRRKRALKIILSYILVLVFFVAILLCGAMRPEPAENSNVIVTNETFFVSEEIGKLKTVPVYYEDYEVKIDFLHNWLLKRWLNSEAYNGYYERMSENEAAEWGVNVAYEFYSPNGLLRNYVALSEGTRFAMIRYEDKFSVEQRKYAAEELGFI